MRKIRIGAATISLLLTFAFVASAQAAITTSNVTTPADGSSLLLNQQTNPTQTFTVSGTTDGTTGDLVDVDCYYNGTDRIQLRGASRHRHPGRPRGRDLLGTTVPLSAFSGNSCELLACRMAPLRPGHQLHRASCGLQRLLHGADLDAAPTPARGTTTTSPTRRPPPSPRSDIDRRLWPLHGAGRRNQRNERRAWPVRLRQQFLQLEPSTSSPAPPISRVLRSR